jgi:hypothetical protein
MESMFVRVDPYHLDNSAVFDLDDDRERESEEGCHGD